MLVIFALLILLVCLVIGVPIPLAFLSSAAFLCLQTGLAPEMLLIRGYNSLNTILLLTIPMAVI